MAQREAANGNEVVFHSDVMTVIRDVGNLARQAGFG